MHQSQTPLSQPSLSNLFSSSDDENAKLLKRIILDLARLPQLKKFKTPLLGIADEVRVRAFGHNRRVTKKKILKLLSEFEICEVECFVSELNVDEKEITEALTELVTENKIVEGKRRRWHEPGKHYNLIYSLK